MHRHASRLMGTALGGLMALSLLGCGTATPASVAPSPTPSPTPRPTPSPPPTPEPTPEVSVNDLVDAVEAMVDAGTVRMEFEMNFEDSALYGDRVGFSGEGQAALGGDTQQMTMSMNMQALGMGILEMILDDRSIYMRGAAFETLLGEDAWLLIDLDSDHPLAAEFGALATGQADTSSAVYFLYGIDGDIQYVGTDRIDGDDAIQVEFEVDLDKAVDEVPAAQRELFLENVRTMREGGIDDRIEGGAWVDEDGRLRKVRYVFELGVALGGGDMVMEATYGDFGAPLELDVPDESDVVPIEDVIPAEPEA
jgi:hypothetical protein